MNVAQTVETNSPRLQDNYEAAEGTSLPRSTLYTHYVSFCNSMTIEPVNAASFGKLIRSIFPNLKTRRLGTRGHSKYHYYGIRIKATSELRLPNFGGSGGMGSSGVNSSSGIVTNSVVVGNSGVSVGVGGGVKIKQRNRGEYENSSEKLMLSSSSSSSRIEEQGGMYDISGMNSNFTIGATNVQLPDFSLPETLNLSGEFSMEMCHTFMTSYRAHCQALVDSTYKHHFMDVDKLLQHFWQSLPSQYRILVSTPDVVDLIIEKDQLTYKAIATVLLPNVLQSLPVSIPQSIRQFAKQLEVWLANSLDGLPQNLVLKKMNVVKKFSQSLHKQASLNHLTQAARAVLQNTTQVSQMIIDWNRLDFEFIKDQATWICQCGEDFIHSAQEDFKRFLTERASLEQWAQWLQEIVHKIIGKTNDARELVMLSQQLLLKWSFYSTLIIRDLTIRNASSFGSFHLLRTLFDEYIFYLVETKFASLVHHQYPHQQQQQQQHHMPIHHQQQQQHHIIPTSSNANNTNTPNTTTSTTTAASSTSNVSGGTSSTSSMGIHPSVYEGTLEGYSHGGHHNGHSVVSNMDSFSLDSLLNKDSSNSLRNKHLPSPFDTQHSTNTTNTMLHPHHHHHQQQQQQLHHDTTNPTSLEEYNSMLHSDINNMIHLQTYGGYSQQQQQQGGLPSRLPFAEDIRLASSTSSSTSSSSTSNTSSNDLKRSNDNLLKSSQQIVYGLPANSPNVTTSDPLRSSSFMSHYDTLLASSTPSNTSPLHYSDTTPNSKKLRLESNEHVK